MTKGKKLTNIERELLDRGLDRATVITEQDRLDVAKGLGIDGLNEEAKIINSMTRDNFEKLVNELFKKETKQ